MRWRLGPVFVFEWLIASRRWQMYALRALLITALLGALIVVWFAVVGWKQTLGLEDLAKIGQPFFVALVGTQLAVVLLVAPAATAGAICLDKSRGTLQHLMVTDLADSEIVLGKLAARLIPVFGLILCSLPVLALSSLLGGIDLMALLGAYMVTLGVAVLSCTLALTLSIWGRKTHEVLLLNYLIWALLLLAYPLAQFLDRHLTGGVLVPPEMALLNPFWLAFRPYVEPGTGNLYEGAVMLGVCLALSLALAFLAVGRIRRVVVRQAGRAAPSVAARRWLSRWPGLNYLGPLAPTLDGNPVLWREWHRRQPSRWMRVVWAAYAFTAVGVSGLTFYLCVTSSGNEGLAAWVNAIQVPVGLLLVSLTAVTSLTEERLNGSLPVLLGTPLTASSIVWGKWWGAYRGVPLLAVLPALVGLGLVLHSGNVFHLALVVALTLVHGAAVISLGLAVAVWVPNQSRALAVTAGVYVVLTAAVPLALMGLGMHNVDLEGLATASTFYGMGSLTFMIAEDLPLMELHITLWATLWLAVHLLGAVILGSAAVLTFDRCLGRLGDFPDRPPWRHG